MGKFEAFCRVLPFYPSVYIGKIITQAKTAFGTVYSFDSVASFGLIPLVLFMTASTILSFIIFKKNMVSDK